jgi:hypothetical protein
MNSIERKLVRDFIYLTETLEDTMDISSAAEREFREALQSESPDALEALAIPKGSVKKEKAEEPEPIKFDDKHFKKIFRKLAVKCHPDKIQDASEREAIFLKKCYEDINLANDTYNWGLLLKVAVELNVEIDELGQEQLDNIQENIESLKNKIKKYEESMAYKWYTLNDTDIKQKYLQSCADIFKNSLRIKLD